MKNFLLHGHMRSVKYVTYNPEGDLIFTTSMDKIPLVWCAETGRLLGSYEGHNGCVWGCDVNYTSKFLATAGADQFCKIWNVRTGETLASIELPTPVKGVQWAHGDEHLLAITDQKFSQTPTVNVFHLPSNLLSAKIPVDQPPAIKIENKSPILFATWGPNNKTIYYTTEDGQVHIADVTTGQTVLSKRVHSKEVFRLRWDPEFLTPLTSSGDSTAKLLDGRTLDVITTYEYEKGKFVFDAVMAPKANHVVLAGGDDPQSVTNTRTNHFEARFCHKISGKNLGGVAEHFGPVNALAFHPLGKGFTSGGEDGMVRIHIFDETYKDQPGVDGMDYML
eukprot:PhM_4_TR571/c0_g1_i1/m.43952/K03246/EIF3I; translation initiation factor 3 subunit I